MTSYPLSYPIIRIYKAFSRYKEKPAIFPSSPVIRAKRFQITGVLGNVSFKEFDGSLNL